MEMSEARPRSGRRRKSYGSQVTSGSRPWVGTRHLAVTHGPSEINDGQEIANRQNRCSGSRHHIQHLKFGRITVIAARHPEIAQNELREKREIKTKKQNNRGNLAKEPGV